MTRRAVLAVVLMSSSVGFAHAAITTDVPTACVTVDVGEDSNATWHERDELLAAGYIGVAGDGAERLYSPSCFTR